MSYRYVRVKSESLVQSSWVTVAKHKVTRDEQELPNPVYTLAMPDWVNIVAITESHDVVLVRQHRFGTQQDSLEIPGGLIDAGESPLEAAKRELLEETGYSAQEWEYVGWSFPNPAIQENKLHTYVARQCKLTHQPELDPMEDCSVELLSWSVLKGNLHRGAIRHSLVLIALYEVMLAELGKTVGAR